MSALRVLVVGAGERVLVDTLPVLASLADEVEVVGVHSRTARQVTSAGREWDVRSLEALDERGLAGVDLVHIVVAKKAVPGVLARLARHDRSGVDLQLETPGLLFRHLAHRDALDAWRHVWVSEDCTTLPFFETIDAFVATGALGRVEHARLDRGAYAYHGVALAKRILGATRVVRGARRSIGGEAHERTLVLDGGRRATTVEPRIYANGSFVLGGERGTLSDSSGATARLSARVEGTRCVGFAIGDVATDLEPIESDLLGDWIDVAGDGRIVPHTHDLKRVGLRRLFAGLARGGDGYALDSALEDMSVDYHLDKVGCYLRNPLTGAHSRWPGRVLRLLGRR